MAPLYKLCHVAIEESEKQGPYMRAVYICICHYYHFMVTKFRNIEIFSYASAKTRNYWL